MVGDVSAYIHGLEWAVKGELELLVKMSRRFIPLHNWVPGLQKSCLRNPIRDLQQPVRIIRYGFRTECIGFMCAVGVIWERSTRCGPS
jgi:hypothetical protein